MLATAKEVRRPPAQRATAELGSTAAVERVQLAESWHGAEPGGQSEEGPVRPAGPFSGGLGCAKALLARKQSVSRMHGQRAEELA